MHADDIFPNRPLTPSETGRAVGDVSGRTILNWEAAGIIRPVIRVGRIVRYDLADVKRCLAAATEAAVRKMQEDRAKP